MEPEREAPGDRAGQRELGAQFHGDVSNQKRKQNGGGGINEGNDVWIPREICEPSQALISVDWVGGGKTTEPDQLRFPNGKLGDQFGQKSREQGNIPTGADKGGVYHLGENISIRG